MKTYQVCSTIAAFEPGSCTQEDHVAGLGQLQAYSHEHKECLPSEAAGTWGWFVGGHVPQGWGPTDCHGHCHCLDIYCAALQVAKQHCTHFMQHQHLCVVCFECPYHVWGC